MNFHQNIEQILAAATPEQRLLWNDVFLRWGERLPISQLFYQGVSAGSELVTYSANKIYIAYELGIGFVNGVVTAGHPQVDLHNELNVSFQTFTNNALVWDTTAAGVRHDGNYVNIKNVYFSRVVPSGGYGHVKFIGYRLSI